MADTLKTSESINLQDSREFNHLRISNLAEFFESYQNNLEYYKSPWKVLSDLEDKLKFENHPAAVIPIDYKDDGCVLFNLKTVQREKGSGVRIVEYEFASFIS